MTNSEFNIADIQRMMDSLELNQAKLAAALTSETDHILFQSTISRVLKGEAKPSMIAFIRYALTRIYEKTLIEKTTDAYPDLLSKFVVEEDSEHENHTYIVKADSPEEAVTKLREMGVNVDGAHNTSDYDCSGKWCSNGAFDHNIEPIKALGAYSVTIRWYLDV